MGYTTDFHGKFKFNVAPTSEQAEYINLFCRTRRMKRDVDVLTKLHQGRHGLNGEYGTDGEFFAHDDGEMGQKRDASIIDYNEPPETQPGLWCHWVVSEGGDELEWDGGEKFYYYQEWLQYMLDTFFKPWGLVLNGTVKWQGEGMDDQGKLILKDNVLTALELE